MAGRYVDELIERARSNYSNSIMKEKENKK